MSSSKIVGVSSIVFFSSIIFSAACYLHHTPPPRVSNLPLLPLSIILTRNRFSFDCNRCCNTKIKANTLAYYCQFLFYPQSYSQKMITCNNYRPDYDRNKPNTTAHRSWIGSKAFPLPLTNHSLPPQTPLSACNQSVGMSIDTDNTPRLRGYHASGSVHALAWGLRHTQSGTWLKEGSSPGHRSRPLCSSANMRPAPLRPHRSFVGFLSDVASAPRMHLDCSMICRRLYFRPAPCNRLQSILLAAKALAAQLRGTPTVPVAPTGAFAPRRARSRLWRRRLRCRHIRCQRWEENPTIVTVTIGE